MKHAYLIMAHGQWELLDILLRCIDDERNDIFVHIDAKVSALPVLNVAKAGLHVLENRVDVRWGDWSVVEAEYALFACAAAHGRYAYYHLLSGADLPLKSQDYIHRFCNENQGREFIGYTFTSITSEVVRKAQRWHLFPHRFKSRNILIRALRAGFLRLQELLGIKRNRSTDFKKGSQWVSVTHDMASYFLEHRDWAEKTFTHTFCADEMVFQTLCWMSPMRENIWCTTDDGRGCMRAIGWRDGCLYDWGADDYDELAQSDALFARKFNCSDMDFIRRIAELSR
ncbi:MAG: beta-1,6-N-acetylglucosaminyltransferase [Bacteroidaceae bacterium]|nr:beta-1,6-N-acetylglucosaminyltransferase [Bacteroidaceae bacterium]